ncbi:MAG: hypothetical protein FWE37_05125 [Spirochaetaceae bacterium]|nr:hypothetical protein [Spirochaetaceae bacterium]
MILSHSKLTQKLSAVLSANFFDINDKPINVVLDVLNQDLASPVWFTIDGFRFKTINASTTKYMGSGTVHILSNSYNSRPIKFNLGIQTTDGTIRLNDEAEMVYFTNEQSLDYLADITFSFDINLTYEEEDRPLIEHIEGNLNIDGIDNEIIIDKEQ